MTQQPKPDNHKLDQAILLELLRCVNDAKSVPEDELNDIVNNTHGRIMKLINDLKPDKERNAKCIL